MIGWSMTNSSKGVAPLWAESACWARTRSRSGFPPVRSRRSSSTWRPPPGLPARSRSPCARASRSRWVGARPRGLRDHGSESDDRRGRARVPRRRPRARRAQGLRPGLSVDVLCAVLSGANWGPFAPPFALRQALPSGRSARASGTSSGPCAWTRSATRPSFKAQADDFIRTLRATRPAPGTSGPLLPPAIRSARAEGARPGRRAVDRGRPRRPARHRADHGRAAGIGRSVATSTGGTNARVAAGRTRGDRRSGRRRRRPRLTPPWAGTAGTSSAATSARR